MAQCALGLEDGSVFVGTQFGATGTAAGEVVFNTAMCGYQEILTDPSYCGQIVAMTSAHIGNYGVNAEDVESRGQHLSGFVVKELARRYSNQRADRDLSSYLRDAKVVGLAGIDTRALTRRLRTTGSLRGVISTEVSNLEELVALAKQSPSMAGQNLVTRVGTSAEQVVQPAARAAAFRVTAIDCGIKQNIVRELVSHGCAVTVVPASTKAEAILERRPSGVLVGNGPGDPAAVTETIESVRKLIGKVPIFGICLGHQLLSLALGAKTYKLKFGHHGANHPVLNTNTGKVEITSQNHGFAVDVPSLEAIGGRVTHVNLYDRSLEGFAHDDKRIFAVQYHPEAAPGPRDSEYLFAQFVKMMK